MKVQKAARLTEYEANAKKRTVTASFRIDEESFLEIQEEARRQMTSVNTIVNQLVTSYARSPERLTGVRVIRIPEPILAAIVNLIPDDLAEELGRRVASDRMRATLASKYGDLNVSNILRLEADIFQHGGYGTYSERHNERGGLMVTFSHGLGKKYSIIATHLLKAMLEEVGSKPKILTTESAIILEFSTGEK